MSDPPILYEAPYIQGYFRPRHARFLVRSRRRIAAPLVLTPDALRWAGREMPRWKRRLRYPFLLVMFAVEFVFPGGFEDYRTSRRSAVIPLSEVEEVIPQRGGLRILTADTEYAMEAGQPSGFYDELFEAIEVARHAVRRR